LQKKLEKTRKKVEYAEADLGELRMKHTEKEFLLDG